jgi:drug/metabolite transporter (DMT)-like permease
VVEGNQSNIDSASGRHRNSVLILIITALLWSTGGILIKSISMHPLAIAGARSTIAAIVLILLAPRLKFIWTKAQFLAGASLALTVLLFVIATKMTTAANAILLQYTAPVYVALLSGPLLGEKIKRRDWWTLAIVIGGMVLFFVDKVSPEHFLGNIIALLSGVSFAGIALGLRMQKGVSTLESVLLGHIFSAVIGLPFLFAGPMPSRGDVGRILVLGIFQIGIPYVLYGIAIRHVSAIEATLIPVLEPILNPIWVVLFFGEEPSPLALAGGAIVIAAIIAHSYLGIRYKTESTPI